MTSRLREAVGPSYLLLCLLLGGSAQGIWMNMVLQIAGVAIIAWAAMGPASRRTPAPARQILTLAALGIGLVGLQMLPLPASLWPSLGGRAPLVEGYRILGIPAPAQSVSLAPYRSLDSLLGIIPPLALFVALAVQRAYRPSWMAAALLAATLAGVGLGALQVTGGGQSGASGWYPYPESSFGFATGFFANANHMADLLVCTLPFLAALLASARSGNRQRNAGIMAGVGAAAVLVLAGIVINHSLAVYLLAPPVLAASALILLPKRSSWRRWAMLGAALLTVGAVVALASASVRSAAMAKDTLTSVESRQEMLATTAHAMADFMPWGSGLGTFPSVYRLYEDPTTVTNMYVIHAHNDYAELALETGAPGILLIIGFLAWWVRGVWRVWRYPESGLWARAASIASAVMLVHSLVDFPLRTAAMAALLATCLALLVERRPNPVRAKGDLWSTRHIVVR